MIKYTYIHLVYIKIYIKNQSSVFKNYIPNNIIRNIFNEEGIDIVIDEKINNKDIEKSDTEIETFDNMEEMRYPQEYEDGGIIVLHDLNEKERIDPRVQAMFKRSRHNSLSIFIISQDYYELPKKTIRANGNIYHIFKLNNFLVVRNNYQDKCFNGHDTKRIQILN